MNLSSLKGLILFLTVYDYGRAGKDHAPFPLQDVHGRRVLSGAGSRAGSHAATRPNGRCDPMTYSLKRCSREPGQP